MNSERKEERWFIDQITKSRFFHNKLHEWKMLEIADELDGIKGELFDWNLDELNISRNAWDKIIHRGIKPTKIFSHPKVLISNPKLITYYRMLAMVSQKSMSAVGLPVTGYEKGKRGLDETIALEISRHLNRIISTLIEQDEEVDRREFDLWRGMAAGSQAQGSWQNVKGDRAELLIKELVERFIRERELVVEVSDHGKKKEMRLVDGSILIMGREPDIGVYKNGTIWVAVEIKGGIDPAGVLERFGAVLKSLRRAKIENPEAVTALIISTTSLTDKVREEISRSRGIIDYFFTLEDLVSDASKQSKFLKILGIKNLKWRQAMIRKLAINDLEDSAYAGRVVFVRVDFNVPIKDGEIKDDTRIRAALPTINYLRERNARLVLASHLGRPKGKVVPELSLKPVAEHLGKLLGIEVRFAPDCVGEEVDRMKSELKDGEILLLENLRFHAEEKKNDPEFAKALANNINIYVNDAFGTAHRAHASTYGMAQYFDLRLAGLLMAKEISVLSKVRENPEKPFIVILGGAKVADKIGIIQNLLPKADKFIIGGGMAYTFLKAKGIAIGNSLLDEEHVELVRGFLQEEPDKFLLPVDHVVAERIEADAETKIVGPDIPNGWIGVDIGPETIKLYREAIPSEGTIFWNGPMGVFEIEAFAKGTVEIARAVADATAKGAYSVTGGGDTVSAIHKAGLKDSDFSHVSTGGGATLEFLAGKELPAIEVLNDKN